MEFTLLTDKRTRPKETEQSLYFQKCIQKVTENCKYIL